MYFNTLTAARVTTGAMAVKETPVTVEGKLEIEGWNIVALSKIESTLENAVSTVCGTMADAVAFERRSTNAGIATVEYSVEMPNAREAAKVLATHLVSKIS